MPGCLYDTSVWVALAFGSHPHFQLAKATFLAMDRDNPAVFCRATQQSFLRHLSSPNLQAAYGAPRITNRDAWAQWEKLSRLPQVRWMEEGRGLNDHWRRLGGSHATASPKAWMDAYLAAFAICGGLSLATLDHDFKAYEPQGLNLLLLHS